MEKLHIHKLSDFFSKIEKLQNEVFDKNSNVFWFRGQSDFEWDLIPGIYRHYKDKITDELDKDIIDFRLFTEIEKTMFFRFSNSYIFKKENEKAVWRTYYYMQHYNVQTRLLDWTENPLVALFFAIIENPDVPASILILDPLLLNEQSLSNLTGKENVSNAMPIFNDEVPRKGELLFEDKKGLHIEADALSYKYFHLDFKQAEKASPLALAPIRIDTRMEMQQSCFTIFGNKINGLKNNPFKKRVLAELIITPPSKRFLRSELLKYGFSYTRVFPDLDGLGKEINMEYFSQLAVMEKFRMAFWKKPDEIDEDRVELPSKLNQSEVLKKSIAIRNKLKRECDFDENPIDDSRDPILPYYSNGQVDIIFIGQDPTIKNKQSRMKINFTLNLDKAGSLKKYLSSICLQLGTRFENIYATNIFKYFYTIPPAKTMHIMHAHLSPNLELLEKELAAFPEAKIVTLGEPVLQLLAGKNMRVRQFWGYENKSGKSKGNFSFCKAAENSLERDFYPFPHQPSISKEFYKLNLEAYIEYMKNQS